jgi:prepilin-type N-terminal cleavage/methylation domain-containing protein
MSATADPTGEDRGRADSTGQHGYTLIELLMALTVLLVAILGLGMGFNSARKLSLAHERHATMAHVAQREIERLQSIPYSQLGLNPNLSTPAQASPSNSTDPTNPDYYVTTGSPAALQWDRSSPTSTETLDLDTSAGSVLPVQAWSVGNLSGQIYDFVTWSRDSHCGQGCPASQNYKRLTVAITTSGGLEPDPVWVSSVIADPNAAPAGGPSGNGSPLSSPGTTCHDSTGALVPCTNDIGGSAVSYFLHDWPATGGTPQAPSADHPTHATVGAVSGLPCTALSIVPAQTTGCPQPDLMDQNPPLGTATTPLYHYSSDQGTTGYPGGRVLQPSGDCTTGAWNSSLSNLASEFWVASPVTATTTFTGQGGLSFGTQTVGSVSATVSFCIALYDVPPSNGDAGSLANILSWPPVYLGAAAYSPPGNWPTNTTQTAFSFNFRGGTQGTVSIAAGHRLGVRIWIKDSVNAAIAVLYDHPTYPAQLELNTQ